MTRSSRITQNLKVILENFDLVEETELDSIEKTYTQVAQKEGYGVALRKLRASLNARARAGRGVAVVNDVNKFFDSIKKKWAPMIEKEKQEKKATTPAKTKQPRKPPYPW